MVNKIIALLLLVILFPLLLLTGLIIYIVDGDPILYWSKRIGLNNRIFFMPKFRTMKINSPDIATHKLKNPEKYLIRFGKFIRKTSIDELPQLLSIIKGNLNFVGPRPALYNQNRLIKLRSEAKVDKIVPGVTGWAQINGRDHLSINEKISLDIYYLNNKSMILDMKILLITIFQIVYPKGVKH
jgi:O-antigen biosynthesis protein WbqP